MTVQTDLVLGFVLAVLRASAWVAVCPPFNTRMIPVPAKIGLAAALAIPVAPTLAAQGVPTETADLLTAALLQVGAGLALGFVTQVLFAALQAAGELIDLFAGFTIASTYDPFTGASQAVIGRFTYLLAVTLLFALDGHVMLVHGFLDSYSAVPLDGGGLDGLSSVLLQELSTFFLAALELAAPVLGAVFLAEVALGLLSRAAPQMNVFVLGFPIKILLTLGLVGMLLPRIPGVLQGILETSVRSGGAVARVFAG